MAKKTGKPVGRPSKITKEVVAKLEQAYKIGANDTEACLNAGIDRSTLFRYEKENEDFCNKKAEWKRQPILKAKFSVYKGLDDPKLALDYLKLRDDEFSPKLKQEVKNITPQIVVASEKDLKALEELKNANINRGIPQE